MATLSEGRHTAEFLVSEANGYRSRDEITIAASLAAALVPGTVLGKRTVGTPSAAAAAGNTGDGAFGSVTVGAGAKPGVYRVICIEPATDAGQFAVEDPNGVIIGKATVGVAFSNQIGFTIADGAANFVAGDSFAVTVADGAGTYQALDLSATNGAAVAAGIAYAGVPILAATQKAVGIVRDAEVNAAELTWPAGITNDQKTAALAQLAALGIIAR